MGITSDEIVKRDARVCVCGQPPEWGRLRGGGVVLACMNADCKVFPAVKGPCLVDAIQYWNERVQTNDTVRKRR